MRQFKDLNSNERKQYWSLLRIYELGEDAISNGFNGLHESARKQKLFYEDLRNIQENLGIELFTESEGLGKVSYSYIVKYGNPFCKVLHDPKGGRHISFDWKAV